MRGGSGRGKWAGDWPVGTGPGISCVLSRPVPPLADPAPDEESGRSQQIGQQQQEQAREALADEDGGPSIRATQESPAAQ